MNILKQIQQDLLKMQTYFKQFALTEEFIEDYEMVEFTHKLVSNTETRIVYYVVKNNYLNEYWVTLNDDESMKIGELQTPRSGKIDVYF